MNLSLSGIRTYRVFKKVEHGTSCKDAKSNLRMNKENIGRLSAEIEELNKQISKKKAKSIITLIALLLWLVFVVGMEIMFSGENLLEDISAILGMTLAIYTVLFIMLLSARKKKKELQEKLKKATRELEFAQEKAEEYKKLIEEKNAFPAKEITEELERFEIYGNQYFEQWKQSGDETDLLAAANCGHPYAVILIVIDMIREELSQASEYSGLTIYEKAKREKIKDLINYCTYFDLSEKDKDFKKLHVHIPFEDDFKRVADSARFISNLIHIRNIDNYEFVDPALYRNLVDHAVADYQDRLVPELHFVPRDFIKWGKIAMTDEERRIMQKVNEKLNPKHESESVEWVYVPDVTGM